MQSALGQNVMPIWSRNPLKLRGTNPSYSTAWMGLVPMTATEGPSWGYPRGRFWDLGTVLEPFCGEQSPKVNKPVKN